MFLFGMAFYLGYGAFAEHIPWIHDSYTLWDNLWLTVFPFMFVGLLFSQFKQIIVGYFTAIPVAIGLIGGIAIAGEFIGFMALLLLIGIAFIIVSSIKKKVCQVKNGT